VREDTQNLTALSLRFGHGLRAATIWAFLLRALATWTPRLIGLLIALELGLLSPLSCVIHCFVQQLLAERPAIGFFLCDEHGPAPTTAPAAQFAVPSPGTTPDPSSSPASTITPRALYELVALASPLLTVVSLLVAVLMILPARRLVPQILPPPTPPPRLSHA
jgi:hypothetical protein